MEASKNHAVGTAVWGIYRLLIIFFALFVLDYAKTIVIPLTIAALLTFLLSPIATKLEKWVGRILSILLVVIFVFSIIGFIGYIFARQLLVFGSNFPKYYQILETKFQEIEFPQNEIFDWIGHAFAHFKETLVGNSQLEVKLLDLGTNAINIVQSFFGSFFNFLSLTGIVFLLVLFMLMHREDILGRVIKLAGQSRIGSTTSAINDASERVFNYLYRFLIVNIIFGMFVATGLQILGIPNAILWGFFAAVLRFIPYIGAWIAAILPIALSFIISDSWYVPILTISFFIILEMITAYVIEPFYYGEGTGVSSFALVVAAIFWTWLWGPIGLLLSTPLTVCLVVLGQYVTNMNFLQILLSQEPALTPNEEFYHRLLTFDSGESIDFVESYLQKSPLISLYDSVIIPILAQAEMDFHHELIDSDQKEEVNQNIREIVEYVGISQQIAVSTEKTKGKILCLSGEAARDDIGINILAQLLALESFTVFQASNPKMHEIFELIDKENPDVICIVALAPIIPSKMRLLCVKLRQRKPNLPIIICLLGSLTINSQLHEKLHAVGTKTVETLSQAIHAFLEIKAT
jgi:predicted PurR-regulated permease PerM